MVSSDYVVQWIDKFGNTEIVENIISIRVIKNTDAKSNVAEILLYRYGSNTTSGEVIKFTPGEILKIYAKNGVIDRTNLASEDLLGIWEILDTDVTPDDKQIKIKCGDNTYKMLSRLYTRDITSTVDSIVFNIVQTTSENGDTQNAITTNIVNTKSDSTAFEEVNYSSLWKTAYDAIAELSSTQYTGDNFTYLFWFDENNVFHWTYPNMTPSATTFKHGDDHLYSIKFKKTEADSISMLIYDAGVDKFDQPILGFYLDPNSGTIKNSLKYQPMTDIRDRIRRGFTDTEFTALDNDVFVALCKREAIARAKAIIRKVGQGLWEASVSVHGDMYQNGALHLTGSSEDGFPAINLRIDKIVHKLDKNGWVTDLNLIEDPEYE